MTHNDTLQREESRQLALQAAIVTFSDDAIISKTLDGIVLSWNASAERIFGYSAREMLGQHITRLFPTARLHEETEFITRLMQGAPISHFETQRIRKDGSVVDISATLSPIRDADGTIIAVSKTARDISHWKRMQAQIDELTADLKTILDHTPGFVSYWNPDYTNRFANTAYLEALGLSAAELRGRHVRDVLGPELYAKSVPAIEAARAGVPVSFERAMTLPDGTTRHHQVDYVADHSRGGNQPGLFAFAHDITRSKMAEQSLKESEAFLDRAGKIAGVGAWSLNLDMGVLHWSDQTCCIHDRPLGYRPSLEEGLGYYVPATRHVIEAAVSQCIAEQVPFDVELELITANQRSIWVRAAGEAQSDDGRVIQLFGAIQDITDRKRATLNLLEQHELMRVTLDSIVDAVITTDANGCVQWLNPVAAQLTGWANNEAVGRPIQDVFHIVDERTRAQALSPVIRALSEDRAVGLDENTILISRSGAEYGVQDSAAPIRDAQGRALGVVLVFHDVSEQRRLAREVTFRASHDNLTGLSNRAEFEVRLTQALAGARHDDQVHALMFIDLDQFKLVNDACGHAAGDELLQQVTAIFRTVVRSRDTLARLGGDEFGVIMDHRTVEQARRVGTQLCECMENFRFVHDERRFRVGASIGLVPLDARWNDTAALMEAADSSCYAAKEAGRNRIHEWVDSDQRLKDRRGETQWATRLEQALDDKQFRLYGQRIVACDGAETGLHLEVLLRLTESDGSILTPAAFLPAAERFHMVTRIDRWVVREVLEWMRGQDLENVGMVSINLSGQSISDRSLHRYVAERVAHLTFDPSKLCFEITETAAITHMGDAADFINAMRALGIRIALDDFGAGASSFGYLKNLAVDFLKIDGQFVRDLLHDRLDHTAVRCFRDVANVCGIRTVAEFVESDAVLQELRKIGIDFAQGYLIHRPEPLERLLALHSQSQARVRCAMPVDGPTPGSGTPLTRKVVKIRR